MARRRRARSRRVQAQRKFAQGAFVPPNAAAAAPADNRRDVIQDPSNVTRNHMSAPNLLDVVSLHSASSSPVRQGLHNPLTSQPVVLVERLRGPLQARGSSPQPSKSQRDTSQPRLPDRLEQMLQDLSDASLEVGLKMNMSKTKLMTNSSKRSIDERQDARVSTTPVQGPKLQTAKKAKEYKRVHTMSLRSRRLSNLELKIAGEIGAPLRKVTFKRKRNSSDEDEPLIYQKNKNKKALQTKNSLKRTAARESAPLVGILKHSTPMVRIPEQYVPKVPSGIAKQSVLKKQSAHMVTTPKQNAPKVSNPEHISSSKKKQRRIDSPPAKSLKTKLTRRTTPEQSTPEQSSPEKSPNKKLAQKSKINEKKKLPIQVTPQKKNSDPAPVIPELLVSVDVETKEEQTNDWINFDLKSAVNQVTPVDWIIPDVPDDPLDTDTTLHQKDVLPVDDMVAKEGALAIDGILVTESTLDIEDARSLCGNPATDGTRASDVMLATEDELALEDTIAKENDFAIDGMLATEGELALDETVAKVGNLTNENEVAIDGILAAGSTLDIDDMIATEDARAFDVMLATESELALDETITKEDILAAESTLNIDGGAADEAVIPSVQVISSLKEDDDEPIEDDLIRLRFDDNFEDEPAEMDKVDNMVEHLGNTSEFLESPVKPCDRGAIVVTSDVTLKNAIKNLPRIRVVSPEPGPSMQYQFTAYDSDTEEQEHYYSNTKIYLENNISDQYLKEVFHKTALNLELERNLKLQKKPCVGASLRSDRDVINASNELLDSCCKVCKPCIRIEKLMKISELISTKIESRSNRNGRNNNTEDPESDEHEEPLTKADQNEELYLLLPKLSRIMLKIGMNVQHGRQFLAVCFIATIKSRKSVFLLEEKEHILDGLIETLTVGQLTNYSIEGRNDNVQIRFELPEDRNDNAEGLHDNAEDLHDNAEGLHDNAEVRIDTEDRNDNAEDRKDSIVCRNVSSENRRISISSDSELSDSSITPEQETTNRVQHHKIIAAKRRLARAKLMHDRIREEKEKEIAALEEQKQAEIARIMAEKNICEAEISRYQERFTLMQKEKEREIARLKTEMREKLLAEMEADRSMIAEVDGMARALENERDAKSMNQDNIANEDFVQPGTSGLGPVEAGVLVDAPVYHPTLEEFADPVKFYEKIWPEALSFGICKIVPPPGWQPPPHKLDDEMKFDVTNQFISRLLSRWGPAARELCAIRLCLLQQNIPVNRLPSVDGAEINLPKLYHMVQRHGGLEQVINRKRWGRVAEDMNFTKGAGTERKLDQIYVKYLLPYDTLSHKERHEIMGKVEAAWRKKHQKLFDRALNPLYRQKLMLGVQDDSEEETEDPDILEALTESEDCIIKGSSMTLNKFKKVATFVYEGVFGQGSESAPPPNVKDIEEGYWRLVTHGAEHTCVNSATIDTGEEGYGCVKNKDSYSSHPWHPKMVSQNRRNVLSYLDSIIGLTVPTLLLGMLYATSCWHKDPHQIAWIEYQLAGAPRVWYGISEVQAGPFRRAVEILCPAFAQNKSLWLPTDIAMIPPDMLRQQNVTLSRLEQNPGEFVMVFPNAYTSCISTGYTVAESVYFAPPSWLKRLWTVFKETRESCEPTMFAMEHLLYNIARDPTADEEIVHTAQPLFERMLHEEVTNRQMLQERGVSFVHELQSDDATPSTSSGKKKAKQYTPRDQEECEYCRATLYLSKVRGLTERNTLLCLEHAVMFLDTEKYKDADVSHIQVLVHVSVKELNTVNDDMKRRLGIR